jgi:signal transduction histidine kinase
MPRRDKPHGAHNPRQANTMNHPQDREPDIDIDWQGVESSSAPRHGRPRAADVVGDVRAGVQAASKRNPYGWFAGGTVLFVAVWLLWWDDGKPALWRLKLWTLFIVASALLVLTPMVRGRFQLSEQHAAQLAAGGAGGLAFAWVAFLLPNIASNEAFFGTLATACAALAAWLAPGRAEALPLPRA